MTFRLLPRKVLKAKRVTIVYDEYNLSTTIETTFNIEDAGVQPVKKAQSAGLEGYRDSQMFMVHTTTELKTVKEGDRTSHADKVELYPNRWFSVVKVEHWDSGVIPHYKAYVVDIAER